MRIRNSRSPFPLPCLPSRCVSRSTHFRSNGGLHFDERFLVEEASRSIGWSSNLLREPLRQNKEDTQMREKVQPAIASETKLLNHVEQRNGKQNCVPEIQKHASHMRERRGNGGRKSILSTTSKREAERSKDFPQIVLALPAMPSRPDKELPIKKRRMPFRPNYWSQRRIPIREARKDQEDANLDKNSTIMPETEASSKTVDSLMGESINCVLNCESSLPSPTRDSPVEPEKTEQLVLSKTATEPEVKPKRKRGRPRRIPLMDERWRI